MEPWDPRPRFVTTDQPVSKWRRWFPMLTIFSGVGIVLLGAAMIWSYLFNLEKYPPDVADPDALALPLPALPSAIVLPFFSVTEVDRDLLIAHRLGTDLAQALARHAGLFLIAEQTSARFRGAQFQIKKTAEALGIRYLITGSVSRAGKKYRIFFRVIDAFTGDVEWANNYDRSPEKLLGVPDHALKMILDVLDVDLDDDDAERLFGRGASRYDAWVDYAEAVAYRVPDDRGSMTKSLARLMAAHAADPGWAAVAVEIAWSYRNAALRGWTEPGESGTGRLIDTAISYAEAAIKADPADPRGPALKAALLALKGDGEASLDFWRAAAKLGPNSFTTHWGLAHALIAAGRHAEALPAMERALRLHPRHPVALTQFLAELRFDAGQPEPALTVLAKVIAKRPAAPEPRLMRAFILGSLGRWDAARAEIRALLDLYPGFSFSSWSARRVRRNQPARTNWLSVLRQAGIPD